MFLLGENISNVVNKNVSKAADRLLHPSSLVFYDSNMYTNNIDKASKQSKNYFFLIKNKFFCLIKNGQFDQFILNLWVLNIKLR